MVSWAALGLDAGGLAAAGLAAGLAAAGLAAADLATGLAAAGLATGLAAAALLAVAVLDGAALAGTELDLTALGAGLALDTGKGAGLDWGLAGAATATLERALTGSDLAGLSLDAVLAGVLFLAAAAVDLPAFGTTLAGAFWGVFTSCLLAV